MMMQPSQPDMNTWLNAKFDPMVEGTPELSELVAKARAREGVNNQNMKSYPGGNLMLAWSGSPKTMRGRSAPKIHCDETDGYAKTGEGHPVSLLQQRAATFGDQQFLFETSTPTFKNESHIEGAFEAGDKRRWFVPCPDCGEKQFFKWSQVTWQKSEDGEHLPETAAYSCECCGSLWNDGTRYKATRSGEWIAEKPFRGHASYHLPELASAFRKLKDIVQSFLDKKAMGDLQTFTNVSLAETWALEGDKQDPDQLYSRREHYTEEVPADAYIVTAAVDVQDDRLEIQYEAWGEGQENWKVAFDILRGDLNKPEKYIGSVENWEKAESAIINAAKEKGLNFVIESGEAAFYGPKLDFMVKDALGRQWQLGTIQVDYNLPERFDLTYKGSDNELHRPVMIHRAPFGSMERFIALLLEHTGGNFPLWLIPEQAIILPVSEKHEKYAEKVLKSLEKHEIRAQVDARNETVGKKIREAEMNKIPFMLIVGESEEAENTIAVRKHGGEDLGSISLETFQELVSTEIISTLKPF